MHAHTLPNLMCLLLLAACGSSSTPSVRPQVSFDEPSPTVATIAWTSSTRGQGHVIYGLDNAFANQTTATASGTQHQVRIAGLKPTTRYLARTVLARDDGIEQYGPVFPFETPENPPEWPSFELVEHHPEQSEILSRSVLMAILSPEDSYVLAIDAEGSVVWGLAADPLSTFAAPRPSLDGSAVLFAEHDRARVEDVSAVVSVDLGGTRRWTTPTETAHHTFIESAQGNLTWLGLDIRDIEEDGITWAILADRVLRRSLHDATSVPSSELFNFFDDSVPFFVPCDHFLVSESRLGFDDLHEWTHANSLIPDPDSDALYMGVRLHDSLLKLDSQGTVLWQMGGIYSDFELVGDGTWWSHGHLSQITSDGFVLFDNGSHHIPQASRVVEYRFDSDAKTVEEVWSHEAPEDAFVPYLGDVRRLPGGNTLIAWSTVGTIQEVNPAGEVVWDVRVEPGFVVGRVLLLSGWDPITTVD